jgi:hypothetical protein
MTKRNTYAFHSMSAIMPSDQHKQIPRFPATLQTAEKLGSEPLSSRPPLSLRLPLSFRPPMSFSFQQILSFRPKGEISANPFQANNQITVTSTTSVMATTPAISTTHVIPTIFVISTAGRNLSHPIPSQGPNRRHFNHLRHSHHPCHFDQKEKSQTPPCNRIQG